MVTYSSTLNKQNCHSKLSHDLINWCFITNIFTAHPPHTEDD